MSYTQKQLEKVADCIISCAYSDSLVNIDKPVLMEQLRCDWEMAGRFPSREECNDMVTGGDTGECPEETRDKFPQTYDFIGTYWE